VIREFHLDGYSLIRVKDLAEIQSVLVEKYFDKMLRSEGVIQHVGIESKIRLSSMPAALRRLGEMAALVSLECEFPEDALFFAGRVVKVDRKNTQLRTFDVLGRWDPELVEVVTATTSSVSWDTEYLRVFSKHLVDWRG